VSAPEVIRAAIAGQTRTIHLGSAVTVLSTDDPIRVFQRFSTLNAISNGRAEAIFGRGSFTESFPLFGFDLNQYELLFEEHLELFAAVLGGKPVTWSGKDATRSSRAIDLPTDRIRRPPAHVGRRRREPGIGRPRDAPWAAIDAGNYRPPVTRAQFEREAGPDGALCIGSPETVAAKIAATIQALSLTRFDMKYSNGTLPHESLMTSIELYATKVAPRVRELLEAAN
jgi:alkanesulfonate monooxygenase SsuD/methylene tetrahydromethanopterin reductase-like flavin-dependent oxidoreductase (luciferase family)